MARKGVVPEKALVMKKSPNLVDKHVGSRVRMRRLLVGMSQEKLGGALGLTFQQVQKYEKGTNRIGASRLKQMSDILGVPIQYFYDGAPQAEGAASGFAEAPAMDYVSDFLSTAEGVQLVKAFTRVKNPAVRRRLVDLIETLGSD